MKKRLLALLFVPTFALADAPTADDFNITLSTECREALTSIHTLMNNVTSISMGSVTCTQDGGQNITFNMRTYRGDYTIQMTVERTFTKSE